VFAFSASTQKRFPFKLLKFLFEGEWQKILDLPTKSGEAPAHRSLKKSDLPKFLS
jgi:hypothetical protein